MRSLYFLLLILLTVLVAIVFAQLVLVAVPHAEDLPFSIFNPGEIFSSLNLLLIATASVTVLFVFFRSLRSGKEFAVKILVTSFMIAGSLSILLIGRLVSLMLGSESQLIFIILAAAAFAGMFCAFLYFIDALSHKVKNRLFVICSGALGAFLGILLPTLPVIGICAIWSVSDAVLVLSDTVQEIFGAAKYEELIMEAAFSTEEWGIGVGDLICYSMIAANTSVYFGAVAGSASLILILAGAFFTLKLAVKRMRVPGLPIATALGLLPSILLLLSS
jgi:hypothetical protein